MPEPYWPKKQGAFTLGDCNRQGSLLRIWCRYCKTSHNFAPDDLRKLFGNIEVDDVTYQMRCSKCRERTTLDIDLIGPSAADRQSLTVRRIDKIDYVKRVRWRDVKGG